MDQDTILKRDGAKLVRKRLIELLKPVGFQTHPISKTRMIRVRKDFIDEVSLRTDSYHLEPIYSIFYRYAPFSSLHVDDGRLWRSAKENITTSLRWDCEFPRQGGSYYYTPDHFEEVWRDVEFVLEHHVLPKMDEMTVEQFFPQFVNPSPYDRDYFCAYARISFDTFPYIGGPSCMQEAAVYGVGLWRQGMYDEGVPYLTFARYKYRRWLEEFGKEEEERIYQTEMRTLDLLDELVSLWAQNREGWKAVAQERIQQVSDNWEKYIYVRIGY